MKLALFDDYRLGVVQDDSVIDVAAALPSHDSGYAANFWLRLCNEFEQLRPRLEELAQRGGRSIPLGQARLRAPVLNPSKIVAIASNYGAHIQEMAATRNLGWLGEFDVFLKTPSSIIGPEETIVLPEVGDREVHHEGELAFVIGKAGKDIPEAQALDHVWVRHTFVVGLRAGARSSGTRQHRRHISGADPHVLGYTTLIDVTVRGDGDRSRRKSYDGFSPVGPFLVTADEVGDPHNLRIQLWVNGQLRQDVNSGEMLTRIPGMIHYASQVMTIYPGDIFSTGSPPGVGKIVDGDTITTEIEKIGRMNIHVKGPRA